MSNGGIYVYKCIKRSAEVALFLHGVLKSSELVDTTLKLSEKISSPPSGGLAQFNLLVLKIIHPY